MICPKCNSEQADHNTECLKCGVIFEKYQKHRKTLLSKDTAAVEEAGNADGNSISFRKLVFFVEPEINPFYFGGRVLIFLIIFAWGWKFILTPLEANYTGDSFLHLINLPFHEAGHILFRPFGRWMTSFGGTLCQLLIPLICTVFFLIKWKNTFGASVSLWWFGENFMDLAPYINDARSLDLLLLGGVTGNDVEYGFHDWEFILNETGLLRYDHTLAYIAYKFGMVLMLISFVWAGYLLFKQYKNLDLNSKGET